MFRVILGLFLGLIIGMGCRGFDIPLPGPPKIIGALVVLSVTLGYVGMDHLLASRAKMAGAIVRPATTAPYCGGPTGLPPSREQTALRSDYVPSGERVRLHLDE